MFSWGPGGLVGGGGRPPGGGGAPGAPAVSTGVVSIQGAAGARDDTLTVDLTAPLDLPGGISYDGGTGGWDTLVLAGGAVEAETLTMLGPQDGVFVLDGLRVTFSNLEPVIDTVGAATLTITATAGADTMVVEDGTVATNTRVRETSGPNFESVEFANKTTVEIVGSGGADSISGGDATPATGLTTLRITGVATVAGMSLAIGTIDIVADTLAVTGAVTGAGAVTVQPQTAGRAISLGSEVGGQLSLTDAELDFVTATTTTVGNQTAGTIAVNGAISPAGTTTLLLVTNAALEDNLAGTDITVTNLGVDAETGVGVTGSSTVVEVSVTAIEARTATGGLSISGVGAIAVGGVTGSLTGLRIETSGDLTIAAAGTITLSDTNGLEVVRGGGTSGNVALTATGGTSDVTANVDNDAISAPRGNITVTAGQDILFGTAGANYDNDVRASGSVTLTAGRDVSVDGFADVASDDFGEATSGGLIVTAGRNIGVLAATGTDGSLGANGSAGATATLTTGADDFLTLAATSTAAVYSNSGTVTVGADRVAIAGGSGITATSGTITIRPASNSWAVLLGSATDVAAGTLELSDAELDRLFAASLAVGRSSNTGALSVSAALSPANASTMTLLGAGGFSGPSGITVTNLAFTDGSAVGATWTMSGTSVTRGGGPAIPATVSSITVGGGSGSDTFMMTPSATVSFTLDGNAPVPPASPGDTVNVDLTGTTGVAVAGAFSASGWAGAYTFTNRNPVTFSELETLIPGAMADVSVAKTGPANAVPGGAISYSITVANAGPSDALAVALNDPLPPGTTFLSLVQATGPLFTCFTPVVGSGGVVTCSIALLAAGASADFTLEVAVPASTNNGTVLVNVATVQSDADDDQGGNNASTVTTEVQGVNVPVAGPAGLALMALLLACAGWLALRSRWV